ncbi:MAG: phospholipid carrier-dependent glycosyltransferase [Desulfuromonadaceae bacterium]|nr:phospholipid carrier-dependent glycosyltransferase [Desulfuromonadaceae bacterium]
MIKIQRIFFAAILLLALATGLYGGEKGSAGPDLTGWGASLWTTYDWNSSNKLTGPARFDNDQGNPLHITSELPNDARFTRELSVDPDTIYHFSCRVRTENIGSAARGAGISVIDILDGSPDIKGSSNGWETVDFYGKTGPTQRTLTVTLGIGGYGSLNSGSAWFKDVRVEKAHTPPDTLQIIPLTAIDAAPAAQSRLGGKVIAGGGCFGLLLLLWGRAVRRNKNTSTLQKRSPAPAPLRKEIDRFDIAVMTVLTVVCLAVSLVNLGGHHSPESGWCAETAGESVTIGLGRETDLTRFYYYCGINSRSGDGSRFTLSARNSSGAFIPIHSFTKEDVNIWKFVDIRVRTSALRLTADTPGGRLNEIALVKRGSKTALVGLKVMEKNRSDQRQNNPEHLIDEQRTFEYAPSFLTGFYFDEIYHARSAWEALHQIEPYETTHPPLGKLLISAGIALFGMNGFGWRIVGTLFGVALVPFMYLFGMKLFRERFYAFCAAFLMMADFMRFAQSRVAVIDVYGVFFILVMYYFILDLFTDEGESARRSTNASILLAGTAFGIGAACKWIALYAGGGMGLLVLFKTIQDLKLHTIGSDQGQSTTAFLLRRGTVCLLAFVLIPVTIYLLAYIPFLQLPGPGHDLADVFRLQKHMYTYHSQLKSTHPFSSPWWSWPLDYRPMWMYSGAGLPPGIVSTIASFGNPAIWWLTAPAIFITALLAIKSRQAKLVVLLLAFSFQYLPWIGVNRLVFIYHFFSAVPFAIFCIVAVIQNMEHKFPDLRPAVWMYLAATGGLFILFYPALSGMQISEQYIASLRWFPTWLF